MEDQSVTLKASFLWKINDFRASLSQRVVESIKRTKLKSGGKIIDIQRKRTIKKVRSRTIKLRKVKKRKGGAIKSQETIRLKEIRGSRETHVKI